MAGHIFVPRWMDRTDLNSQNQNARALLSRFSKSDARWTAICGHEPDPAVVNNGIDLLRLSRSRFWKHELFLRYQGNFDAVFYPGVMWPDEFGIRARKLSGRSIPLIATIEGIIASQESVNQLSELMGHPVFSQPGTEPAIPRIRWLYETADHIVAISPFLEKAAKFLYGEKVSHLPLGVDTRIFYSKGRMDPDRCRVVSCGTVKHSKNPRLFLRVAATHKDADFVWFGDGDMRQLLIAEAAGQGLDNIFFPGALLPDALAEEFRKSSLFVLPSHAEGVPKVTYEAAACGLPIVLNGFFEAPTVIHGQNGLVSWSDEELFVNVGMLIHDQEFRCTMGRKGAEMANRWNWDLIARQWENLVTRLAA